MFGFDLDTSRLICYFFHFLSGGKLGVNDRARTVRAMTVNFIFGSG